MTDIAHKYRVEIQRTTLETFDIDATNEDEANLFAAQLLSDIDDFDPDTYEIVDIDVVGVFRMLVN